MKSGWRVTVAVGEKHGKEKGCQLWVSPKSGFLFLIPSGPLHD